ncbi:HAMP domain-containing protein [Dactylosporangium cerinum]
MRGVKGGLIRRMVLATCVLLLFVGGAFGTLLISIGEDRETTRLSRRTHQLFTAADQVHRKTVDLQAAQQAYTISGDGVFLGRWQAASSGVLEANATLETLASTAAQRRLTQRITRTSTSYVQDYSLPALNAARRGDPAARSTSTLLEGERRIGQLRVDLGVLRTSERDVLAARDARAEAMVRREMFAVLAGLTGSAIVIALVGGYQTRLLVQPIRRAATMADRLAGGRLDTRMPETGKAEIGQLERSFNVMGDSLQGAHDDLIASRARVVLATDQTRRRIERDLHDGVQQRLLSLGLDIRRIELSVPPELPELRAELSEVVAGINGTVDDVREISRGCTRRS